MRCFCAQQVVNVVVYTEPLLFLTLRSIAEHEWHM